MKNRLLFLCNKLKRGVVIIATLKGSKSKSEKVQEAINSAPVVDINVNINIPKIQTVKEEKKYKCSCCGDSWDTQKSHFTTSKSILFQSNNGYINVCNDCRDSYYYQLIDLYSGSEEKAILHMCNQFGWIYETFALEASRQVSVDRSRISHYIAKKNLPQTTQFGYTDIDTVKNDYINRKGNVIESSEHLEQLKANGQTNISVTSAERWGYGVFPEEDIKVLDDHYKMLKKYNPNCDNNQEIFIKSLCHLNLLQTKALKDNNTKAYIDANSEYAKTFKQAGLKTIEEKDNSNNETVGVTLATISQFTPEEFYKDKTLFSDNDNIGDYYDRHICRPMKNLMFDGDVRDKEFFVSDGDIEDDD